MRCEEQHERYTAPGKLPQRLGMQDWGIRYAIGAMTATSRGIGTAGPQTGAGMPTATPVAGPTSWFGQLFGILVRFDKKKMQPPMALRNTMGVILPLIAGYAMGMPRGGLAMASGALNASYSDGSDPYAQRAKRMLASTTWCSVAVLLGALTGHHNAASVAIVHSMTPPARTHACCWSAAISAVGRHASMHRRPFGDGALVW